MKAIILVSLVMTLVACDPAPHPSPEATYRVTCLNGVQYYTSGYKLAVKFNRDSTVATCGSLE